MAVFCLTASAWAEQNSQPAHKTAIVHIERDGAAVTELYLEVADTPISMMRGLMFRQSLPSRHGMLFVHPTPHNAQMWMKNTLIPLDMVFVDSKRSIVHIHPQAQPHSLETIGAGQDVAWVIEIQGGEAATLDIRTGDTIRIIYQPDSVTGGGI